MLTLFKVLTENLTFPRVYRIEHTLQLAPIVFLRQHLVVKLISPVTFAFVVKFPQLVT